MNQICGWNFYPAVRVLSKLVILKTFIFKIRGKMNKVASIETKFCSSFFTNTKNVTYVNWVDGLRPKPWFIFFLKLVMLAYKYYSRWIIYFLKSTYIVSHLCKYYRMDMWIQDIFLCFMYSEMGKWNGRQWILFGLQIIYNFSVGTTLGEELYLIFTLCVSNRYY